MGSLRPLPSGSQGTRQVLDPTSSREGNVFSDAKMRAARAKNWIPYKWQNGNFVEITAGGVRGDVDGNGVVDIDDLNIVINIMVKKATMAQWPNADVDKNGVVDIDDLNIIINIMVKKATKAQWPNADIDKNGEVDIDDLNIVINIMVHKDNG